MFTIKSEVPFCSVHILHFLFQKHRCLGIQQLLARRILERNEKRSLRKEERKRISRLGVTSLYIRVRTHIKIRMEYTSRASRVYPSRFFNVVKSFTSITSDSRHPVGSSYPGSECEESKVGFERINEPENSPHVDPALVVAIEISVGVQEHLLHTIRTDSVRNPFAHELAIASQAASFRVFAPAVSVRPVGNSLHASYPPEP